MVIIISYNKQTWNEYNDNQTADKNLANGAIISADKLNHMETGISNNDTNKVTDNKNGSIEVNGSSITPADDSKVVHSTVTQLNSTDMNTVLTAGFYKLNSGTNGMPNADAWTIYQVIPLSSLNGVQVAYGTNNTILGMRSWNNNPGVITFTRWVRFADDSKVVHSTDMRKPASDVAGIDEVNAKQDKIGYTPADDSKVVHDNHDNTITANKLIYDLSKTGITQLSIYKSGSFNDLPLGTVFTDATAMTDGPDKTHGFTTTTFYSAVWGGRKAQIAITDNANLMYFRVWSYTSKIWTSWALLSDDSKVVHSADMRKPASDVAGIEEVSTLQTQVNNSAVGTNLIIQSELKSGFLDRGDGSIVVPSNIDFHSDNYIATNGANVFTLSSPDYAFKSNYDNLLQMYDSNKKSMGYQVITSATQTLSKSNVAYIRLSINFALEGGTSGNLSDWLDNHRYKLEKGSVATDWCPNPEDKVNVSDMRKPASDVAGIEEVNAKQDKIGYTPADDSKVTHNSSDDAIIYGNNNIFHLLPPAAQLHQ